MQQDKDNKKLSQSGQNPVNDSANSALLVERGREYLYAQQYDEARKSFEAALQIDPDYPDAYNGLGHLHYHTGPHASAVEAYERSIALDPGDVWGYYGLAILYSTKMGEYERAIETCMRGLQFSPRSAFLLTTLATMYARKGDFARALEYLHQVLEQEPESTYALGWLSIIYLHQKHLDEMIEFALREIAVKDGNDARRMLGYAHRLRHDLESAIHNLRRAVELDPQDYEARSALAYALRQEGQVEEGARQMRMAHDEARNADEYGQACIESVSGNVERAIELLTEALEKQQLQVGWARIDPEFVFLQDEPTYQALIARHAGDQ